MDETIIEEREYPGEVPVTQSTQCEHYMVWESEDTAVCQKGCGHGCSLDRDEFYISDGKVLPVT